MAKVRLGRKEMDSIVNVAERMAKRRNAHFVVDHEKVEVVEETNPNEPPERAAQGNIVCE
jgi:hypothetical protein